MNFVIQTFVTFAAIAVFVWLLMGSSSSARNSFSNTDDLIDPNDTQQLAKLIGMAGGDVTDVAIARFAIQRFQEQYGRSPNTRDIGTLIGIMQSL